MGRWSGGEGAGDMSVFQNPKLVNITTALLLIASDLVALGFRE